VKHGTKDPRKIELKVFHNEFATSKTNVKLCKLSFINKTTRHLFSKNVFADANFEMVGDKMEPVNLLSATVVIDTLEDSICVFAERILC
jgi:hypothetical protein